MTAAPSTARSITRETEADRHSILPLTRDLCAFNTGVVADGNELLFSRLQQELPFRVHRYASGSEHNGWVVPGNWRVERATIERDGVRIYDGTVHPLGVAMNSKSFAGTLDWEELNKHLVSSPALPDAHMFHSVWHIRSWAADWALCLPHRIHRQMGPGKYRVDLATSFAGGEMLVGEYEHRGRSDQVILFNTNNCHPTQANDGFAASALLVRLFQWLQTQDTYYTYRLIIAPEHLGSTFYMRDRSVDEVERMVSCVFAEMPGNRDPLTIASTFLGGQALDMAFRNAARHYSRGFKLAEWRQGCGNDETVWEAPGHEIPTVEFTRARDPNYPYAEYHSSDDNPDLMDPVYLTEFHDVLQRVVQTFENNAVVHRHFDGLICLSNPSYDLYFERHDPTIDKGLSDDDERWGRLLDSLFRYFDGSLSLLEIAERHQLPFDKLRRYVERFQQKGLVSLTFAHIHRPTLTRRRQRS